MSDEQIKYVAIIDEEHYGPFEHKEVAWEFLRNKSQSTKSFSILQVKPLLSPS